MAQELLRRLLPRAGKSVRVGITGVPGVGKSTFIEALGVNLLDRGHRVAVLAVDPSSSVTRGSILGDKTRMAELSRREEAFIRPSPTSGDLGGVTRKSRETIVLCEAFGYDVVLVETVGVGQSETTVRSMVDFFMLLMLAGAGDELQGIKKGVIELADALVINKADGDNERAARMARNEYTRALHYLAPATSGWQTRAHMCSALTKAGVDDVWQVVERFCTLGREGGVFEARRRKQVVDWTLAMAEQHVRDRFYRTDAVKALLDTVRGEVARGQTTAAFGAQRLLDAFYSALATADASDASGPAD
jgi:LAO/AO transport system kinase